MTWAHYAETQKIFPQANIRNSHQIIFIQPKGNINQEESITLL